MGSPRLLAALLFASAAALGAARATVFARLAADTGAPDTGADTGDSGPTETADPDSGGAVDGATGETAAPVDSGADTGEALDTAGEAIPLLSAAQVAGEVGGYNCQVAPAGLSWIGLGVGLVALGRRRR